MKLADILKDSNYKLSQFTMAEIEQLEQTITLKATKNGEVPYTVCLVRQKAIKLTPEEAIRQLYLRVLRDRLHYPLSRIQVEYGVNFGREVKRADIVVIDKDRPNTVYMLVELKKPKYDQAEEAIKDCGFPSQNLGSLIEPIQNGFDYREYTEEGTPYIRVGDIKNGQINFESAVKIPITMADIDKPVGLQVGDILFTRKGSFGNSAVVTKLEVNGIISSEIMLLRLTSVSRQKVLPEYVSLFLNSKFGYLQVERRVHGVAYYSISQPDLANLLIPILPKPQQQKIVEKIKSSFSLKLKSKQLLEITKTGVERAIETDEAAATTWMNQQLEALGITLTATI